MREYPHGSSRDNLHDMSTIERTLHQAVEQLLDSDSPRLDAEVLLAHVLEKNRSYLVAWPERELSDEQASNYQALIDRRVTGEPVAHILGRREFWSLDLAVTPDTLIPRPDTERLVELALELIPVDAAWAIADLGTGSGAIALALASERPGCRIVASDASAAALRVAQGNAERLGLDTIAFMQGDWCAALGDERFELIVSNPPYIPAADPHLQQGDVRFDPSTALVSGEDGLDDIRLIAAQARHHLHPGGWLLIEHGYDQAQAAVDILQQQGFQVVEDIDDWAGQPRVVRGRLPQVHGT